MTASRAWRLFRNGMIKMGTIKASCGHILGENETTVQVREGFEDCDVIHGFQPCVLYLTYCPRCAESAKSWKNYLPSDVPDEWWHTIGYDRWKESFSKDS